MIVADFFILATVRLLDFGAHKHKRPHVYVKPFVFVCAGKDLNLRSPKATDLQSVVIDRSTTDACRRHEGNGSSWL